MERAPSAENIYTRDWTRISYNMRKLLHRSLRRERTERKWETLSLCWVQGEMLDERKTLLRYIRIDLETILND